MQNVLALSSGKNDLPAAIGHLSLKPSITLTFFHSLFSNNITQMFDSSITGGSEPQISLHTFVQREKWQQNK